MEGLNRFWLTNRVPGFSSFTTSGARSFLMHCIAVKVTVTTNSVIANRPTSISLLSRNYIKEKPSKQVGLLDFDYLYLKGLN